MKRWEQKQTGFTIVELLIVIVVIAILAAITVVSYTGIRDRATAASVQAATSQANEKILAYAAVNNGQYPESLADADIKDSSSAVYQYTVDNSVTPNEYALTASNGTAGSTSFYVSSTQTKITNGIAPGHNLIAWNKPNSDSAPAVLATGVSIDTSVYRNATASIKLSPGSTNKPIRSSPITATPGQVITVSAWVLTDANWDGTGNNSKIRYGGSDGLLGACSYGGVKTTWTFVTCSRTVTSDYPTISITLGNDGSTGNVWLDDISLSIK